MSSLCTTYDVRTSHEYDTSILKNSQCIFLSLGSNVLIYRFAFRFIEKMTMPSIASITSSTPKMYLFILLILSYYPPRCLIFSSLSGF